MFRPSRIQQVLAGLVAAMGASTILSALLAFDVSRMALLRDLLPMEIAHASRSLALLAGFGLLVLARGLWRGKRVSWQLTLAALVVSALLHLAKGLDWEEATSALVLAGLLACQHRQFFRHSDPPTLRRVPLFVAAGLLGIGGYGLVGFTMLRAFQPFRWPLALQELAAQLLWSDGPYAALVHGRASWFLDSFQMLGLAFLLGTLYMLLRPVLPKHPTATQRQQAEALVQRYASSSLAPFALENGMQLYLGESCDGVVAYQVAGGVAVVCGDPIAAPEAVGALAGEFAAFCARQDWQVCFYEVQPGLIEAYAPLGFEQAKIGEDAWIDLPNFTLKGSKISDIRHAVSKVERDGTRFQLLDPAQDGALWQQMQQIEAAWRSSQGGITLQFSIGHLPAQPGTGAHYSAALAADGSLLAFCSFLPIPGIHGLALDVMRRSEHCPNGTMEFLLARSLETFRDAGYLRLSLGLAPLANVDAPTRTLLERGIRAIYQNPQVNAAYHYQSLFFFKRKFNPQWRGGYLLYPHALALPQVLAAVVRVHAPGVGPRMLLEAARERLAPKGAKLAVPAGE